MRPCLIPVISLAARSLPCRGDRFERVPRHPPQDDQADDGRGPAVGEAATPLHHYLPLAGVSTGVTPLHHSLPLAGVSTGVTPLHPRLS